MQELLSLQGQYSLGISIQSGSAFHDLDLTTINISSIKIIESAIQKVPSAEIEVFDDLTFSERYGVYDGSKIWLSLTPQTSEYENGLYVPYRVFSIESAPTTYGEMIKLLCYLDAPNYFKDSGFEYVDGNSSDVALEQVVHDDLIIPDVDEDTSDSMVWIRGGMTGYDFVQHATRHAYANEDSCYVCGMTRGHELRFYNLGARRGRDAKWNFISSDDLATRPAANEIPVEDFRVRVRTGVLNRHSGYGKLFTEFNYEEGKILGPEDIGLNHISKSTDNLGINPELMKPPRYQLMPFNVGNTHDNYAKAKAQNERLLSTFSTSVRLSSRSLKEVQLFDRVSLNLRSLAKGGVRNSLNGDYFIDHLLITVTNSAFHVLYNLVREGMNNPDAADLL